MLTARMTPAMVTEILTAKLSRGQVDLVTSARGMASAPEGTEPAAAGSSLHSSLREMAS